MTDIVITEFLEPGAVEALRKDFRVHWDRELWTKRADLEKLVRNVPGLIVRNRTPVDRALLEMAPKLRVVGRLGVGLDNIDVAECERRGIEVCSARGANATSVSEYAIAMAMILLRGRAIAIRTVWWRANGPARGWAAGLGWQASVSASWGWAPSARPPHARHARWKCACRLATRTCRKATRTGTSHRR